MPKKSKRARRTLAQLEEIIASSKSQRELNKIAFKEQEGMIELHKETREVQRIIKGLLEHKEFDDVKTTLTIRELLKLPVVVKSGHIKRPPNNFILQRMDVACEFRNVKAQLSVHEITLIVKERRKNPNEVESKFWEKLALVTKQLHEHNYPSYKYSPKRKSQIIVPSQPLHPFAADYTPMYTQTPTNLLFRNNVTIGMNSSYSDIRYTI
ncbi:17926_t:CDS:1 [Acaulospora morrowiae]|uniref:17926_t:CDS:1 n=1 Tax=Acaulospora morrowiae TaxID=94023 RepID=A0A9N9HNI5_9GLOM|nr:17926_t:CDS:1 [Acaulospora morrowiae]